MNATMPAIAAKWSSCLFECSGAVLRRAGQLHPSQKVRLVIDLADIILTHQLIDLRLQFYAVHWFFPVAISQGVPLRD